VAARVDNTQIAADGYRAAFTATQARYKGGLASLPELEDARRTAINADTVQLSLQRDRLLAWVALYRAVGGGWQPMTFTQKSL
jgi:outer membrane protein TolC